MFFHISLFFHFAALFITGGGALGSLIVERQLWNKLETNPAEAKSLISVFDAAEKFIKAGVVLFLISGIMILWSLQFSYLREPWFIVKFLLFIVLPIRGAKIASPTIKQIGVQIEQDINNKSAFDLLKKKMHRFHIIQYAIVVVILVLVIFKP
jgi:hypothetical protein